MDAMEQLVDSAIALRALIGLLKGEGDVLHNLRSVTLVTVRRALPEGEELPPGIKNEILEMHRLGHRFGLFHPLFLEAQDRVRRSLEREETRLMKIGFRTIGRPWVFHMPRDLKLQILFDACPSQEVETRHKLQRVG